MDPLEILKWAGSTGGVAVIGLLVRAAFQAVKRSTDRDDLLKRTSTAVTDLSTQVKEHTNTVGSKLDDLSDRTTRVEFILTGDKGQNGVRGQVTKLEGQVADLTKSLYEDRIQAAKADRRKTPRRKTA